MNIKTDSRKIEPGDTFVALNNYHDGSEYVIDAIRAGASKVVVRSGSYNVETVVVPDTKQYLIDYLKENYYEKIKDLNLIGVTGTNGKTTTCFLIYQALNKLNIKCAYIGTIGFYLDKKVKSLNNTTPDILELYELLLEVKQKGYSHVVMEVSSHALDQRRVNGLYFDTAIFTNLTIEHQTYHGSMKNYALTKQKLFHKLKDGGNTIVNTDDNYKDYFLNFKSITFGFRKCQNTITDYKICDNYSTFKINNDEYKTKLLGKYNIYNLTVVILYLKTLGISNIKELIYDLNSPAGRLEMIKYHNNTIIIDYAHTPDGVKNILKTALEIKKNNIYVIIGCGGGSDHGKRSIMGSLASKLADYVIFTSDNPRDEDPNNIIQDMIQNLDTKNYEIVVNRKKAIEKGIQKLRKNDILLLLGRGHEEFQVIKKKRIKFNDKEVVLDIIRR